MNCQRSRRRVARFRKRRLRTAAQLDFERFVEAVVQYGEEQGLTDYDYEEVPLFKFALDKLDLIQSSTAYLQLLRSIPDEALAEILGEDPIDHDSDIVGDLLGAVIVHAVVNEAAKRLL